MSEIEALNEERKELLRRFSVGELKSYEVTPLLNDLNERMKKAKRAAKK